MIDWQQFAKINGMSPDEFEKEIFLVAAALGAKKIDESNGDSLDLLKFKCTDSVGNIEIYVRRTD